MNNPNWLQILFIVLVFGGGAIQWVFRKLAEQRAIQQARSQAEREEMERLRTGRIEAPEQAAPETSVDLDAIAARRQSQLEELRRRQQASRRPTGAPVPGQSGANSGPAGRPTGRPMGKPTGRPTGRPVAGPFIFTPPEESSTNRRDRASVSEAQHAREAARASSKRTSALERGDAAALEPSALEQHDADHDLSEFAERVRREEADRKAAKQLRMDRRRTTIQGLVPSTPQQWRQAIIASEILAKPISQRPAAQQQG